MVKIDSKKILEVLKKGPIYLEMYIEEREDIDKETDWTEDLKEIKPKTKYDSRHRLTNKKYKEIKKQILNIVKERGPISSNRVSIWIKGSTYKQTHRHLLLLYKNKKVDKMGEGVKGSPILWFISKKEKTEPIFNLPSKETRLKNRTQQMDVK